MTALPAAMPAGLLPRPLAELMIGQCHDVVAARRTGDLATIESKIRELEIIPAPPRHERNIKPRLGLAREARLRGAVSGHP